MKKIIYISILGLFLASCSSQNSQEELVSLRQKQNELKQELTKVNQQIASLEKTNSTSSTKKTNLVKVTTLKPTVFNHFIKAQGSVETDNNIFIPVEMPGVIKKVLVDEGDKVFKGQVLAHIDDVIIKKQLDELQTAFALAKTVFERQQRLWDKEIGSEIQYLKAKNQKESLEKKIETVNEQLKKAQITSPINGVVETVALKKGEMAAAGISGIRVIQMSKLKVVAPVSEKYFGKIKKGNKATIKTAENKTLNNLEVAITGKSIHPDDRTFSVEVNIPSNAQGFITNMIVELQILDYHNENALVIPINIIKKNDKNNFLFVAEKQGNKIIARKKIIETGEIFNTSVEIIKGLKTGDRIISSGYQELIDGATVIIK